MAGPVAGYNATIDGTCNYGSRWEVELTQEALDASNFCSRYMTYVAGLLGGRWTVEAFDRISKLEDADTVSVAFENDIITITGDVITESETHNTPVEDVVTTVYSGVFTGSITRA